jgi:hypothetical protein
VVAPVAGSQGQGTNMYRWSRGSDMRWVRRGECLNPRHASSEPTEGTGARAIFWPCSFSFQTTKGITCAYGGRFRANGRIHSADALGSFGKSPAPSLTGAPTERRVRSTMPEARRRGTCLTQAGPDAMEKQFRPWPCSRLQNRLASMLPHE